VTVSTETNYAKFHASTKRICLYKVLYNSAEESVFENGDMTLKMVNKSQRAIHNFFQENMLNKALYKMQEFAKK